MQQQFQIKTPNYKIGVIRSKVYKCKNSRYSFHTIFKNLMQPSSIQLQEIDEDWEPDEGEIREYAEYIGINPDNEPELLYLAKEGLKAPLPVGWIAAKTEEGEVYYQNIKTKEALWDHPCDEIYRQKVISERQRRAGQKVNTNKVIPDGPPMPPQAPKQGGSSLLSQISMIQKSQTQSATQPSSQASAIQMPVQQPIQQKQVQSKKSDEELDMKEYLQLQQQKQKPLQVDDISVKSSKQENFLNNDEMIQRQLEKRQAARAPSPTSNFEQDRQDNMKTEDLSGPEVELSTSVKPSDYAEEKKSIPKSSQQDSEKPASVIHNDEFINQQKKNAQDIYKITQQHADQVRKLTQQQSDELLQMGKQHCEKVNQTLQDNKRELQQIQQKHEDTIMQLKAKYQNEYMSLQNQLREKYETEMHSILLSTVNREMPMMSNVKVEDVQQMDNQNKQFQLKFTQLSAQNALLQQQILDTEKVAIERRKTLSLMQNDIEMYQNKIQQLQTHNEQLKDEYNQVKMEIQQLNGQLNESYKLKQYTLNQISTQDIKVESQLKIKPEFNQCQQISVEKPLLSQANLDAFSSFGTALIYSLPDQLKIQLLNEKQLIQSLCNKMQYEKQHLDLKIKSIEAKQKAYTAESQVLNSSDKNIQQAFAQARKGISIESKQVQMSVVQFKEGQDFLKRKKQFLNAFLTTCFMSCQQYSQILQTVTAFCQKNSFSQEDLVQNVLSLDQSSQFDQLFENLKLQVQQNMNGDEIKRLSYLKESFLTNQMQFDIGQIKLQESEHRVDIVTAQELPYLVGQILRKMCKAEELVYEDFQPIAIKPKVNEGTAPWVDAFRKGLK